LITENLADVAQHDESLAIGEYSADLENCRVVKEVWRKSASDSSRTLLTYKTTTAFRSLYPKLEASDTGTPAYWTLVISRYSPSQAPSGIGTEFKRVLVMPPTDEALTLEVFGVFHAFPLTDNDDENFWSVNYPDVLVYASLRSLEASYRNTQGVQDWDSSIASMLTGIDKDDADQATADDLQMKG